jgi:phenylpyruvate tautomerase PptA (4-oxalocrotonate tautomerase family)
MPLIKMTVNVSVAADRQKELLAAASKAITEITRKPEQYVMVTLDTAEIMMGGNPGAAAFVEVRGIGGLTPEINRQLAKKFCGLLQRSLDIPPEQIYLNFTDVAAVNWGWNGATFG